MSAAIFLHPASRDLMAAIDWGWEMLFGGYDVRMARLSSGAVTLIARPPETARTNAHITRIPRYQRQYRHVGLPDDPPPAAA